MLADANRVPDPPHTKQRLSGAERRAAIVNAAVDLFSQRGFRGTTTRELASAVGVSEPVLYQHFATKRDLYTAIVDQLIEESTAAFQNSRDALGADCDDRTFFQWLGKTILTWHATRTKHARLLYFAALEGHELADLWHDKAITTFTCFVEEYVSRRIAAGAFSDTNPRLAARAFTGAIAHYGLSRTLFRCNDLELSQEEVVSSFVDLYLYGILARQDSGAQS